jgi:hypothetical protein
MDRYCKMSFTKVICIYELGLLIGNQAHRQGGSRRPLYQGGFETNHIWVDVSGFTIQTSSSSGQ